MTIKGIYDLLFRYGKQVHIKQTLASLCCIRIQISRNAKPLGTSWSFLIVINLRTKSKKVILDCEWLLISIKSLPNFGYGSYSLIGPFLTWPVLDFSTIESIKCPAPAPNPVVASSFIKDLGLALSIWSPNLLLMSSLTFPSYLLLTHLPIPHN